MKKIAALFTDSFHEFQKIRTLTTAALFAGISIILGYLTLEVGSFIKIGFSTLSNQFVYYMFGPVVGSFFGGMLDILKYLIKPTGPYFPGFTIGAAIGGLIYGTILYKKPLSIKRIFLAELTASIICNMLLGTYWLSVLYGKGFMVLFPMRVLKNLIMLPINTVLFYTIGKTLEKAGVFRLLKEPRLKGRTY